MSFGLVLLSIMVYFQLRAMQIYLLLLYIICSLLFLFFSYNLASITCNKPFFLYFTLAAFCIFFSSSFFSLFSLTLIFSPSIVSLQPTTMYTSFSHQLQFIFIYMQYAPPFLSPNISCSLFLPLLQFIFNYQ